MDKIKYIIDGFQKKIIIQNCKDLNVIDIYRDMKCTGGPAYVILFEYKKTVFSTQVGPGSMNRIWHRGEASFIEIFRLCISKEIEDIDKDLSQKTRHKFNDSDIFSISHYIISQFIYFQRGSSVKIDPYDIEVDIFKTVSQFSHTEHSAFDVYIKSMGKLYPKWEEVQKLSINK